MTSEKPPQQSPTPAPKRPEADPTTIVKKGGDPPKETRVEK